MKVFPIVFALAAVAVVAGIAGMAAAERTSTRLTPANAGEQCLLHFRGEASPDFWRTKCGDTGYRISRLERQWGRGEDRPHTVFLQPPERLLGVIGLPLRAEASQKLGEGGFNIEKRDLVPRGLPLAEGIEDQEWLVRRATIALSPHGQVVEQCQEFVFEHWRPE